MANTECTGPLKTLTDKNAGKNPTGSSRYRREDNEKYILKKSYS